MKRKKVISALCLALCILFSFTGCRQSNVTGNTIDEPEITPSYLTGEYADQLLRDGAQHYVGSLSVKKGSNNTYEAFIKAKKLVKSEDYDQGYYIADRNISLSLPCSPDARVTYLKDGQSAPQIITVDQLLQYTADDDANGITEEKLYDIYEIGGSVELILAKELK